MARRKAKKRSHVTRPSSPSGQQLAPAVPPRRKRERGETHPTSHDQADEENDAPSLKRRRWRHPTTATPLTTRRAASAAAAAAKILDNTADQPHKAHRDDSPSTAPPSAEASCQGFGPTASQGALGEGFADNGPPAKSAKRGQSGGHDVGPGILAHQTPVTLASASVLTATTSAEMVRGPAARVLAEPVVWHDEHASVLTATTSADMVGVPAARALAEPVLWHDEHASVSAPSVADAAPDRANFELPKTTRSTADASKGPFGQVIASGAGFPPPPLDVACQVRESFQSQRDENVDMTSSPARGSGGDKSVTACRARRQFAAAGKATVLPASLAC